MYTLILLADVQRYCEAAATLLADVQRRREAADQTAMVGHVATTTAPAMTFAPLVELNKATMTSIAATATTITSITATMGSLKEATTANATSIAHLVKEMKEAKTASRLVTKSVMFKASLANQPAAVEARSYRDMIVVQANEVFVVTPAVPPNHIEATIR